MSNSQSDADQEHADPSRTDETENPAELEETHLDGVSGAGYPQGKDPTDIAFDRWRNKG